MRKLSLLFIFINLYAVAYNQVLKGTVKDQRTDSAIYFASVYFNGTFVGTQTDQNGYFELDISKNASMPLTISALEYKITCYLDKFEFCKTNNFMFMIGNIIFEEDSTVKRAQNVSNFTKLPSSRIYLKRKFVYFDKNGYFDPSGIMWSGELARQRIADWLPYEYSVR